MGSEQLRVSGVVTDSIVDGPGIRTTIFVQGCLLQCVGCHNPETWPLADGYLVSVERLLETIAANRLATGVTISGGEPTLQAQACAALARGAHQLGKNVWCYTGYRYEALCRSAINNRDLRQLLAHVDVLVDGPFVLAKRTLSLPWRGSSNQRVINLAKERGRNLG